MRNAWAADIDRAAAELNEWLAKQDEIEQAGGQTSIALATRLGWARVELADAMKAFRHADRRVQKLMAKAAAKG